MKQLLDSVIIIDHLNNIQNASTYIANNFNKSCISVITRAEVLAGCNKNNLELIEYFLDQFQTFSIGPHDADTAAHIRREYKIKLPDAFQAALAKNNKVTLVTRNTKDFVKKKIKGLSVEVPYKI